MSKKQNAAPTPNIAETLFQELKDQEAAAQAGYAALVKRFHGGENVPTEESLEILRLVRKSPDDLERAVGALKRIDELQAIVAELPALQAERSQFNANAVAKANEFKAEQLALEQKMRLAAAENCGANDQFRFREQQITDAKRELNALQQANSPAPTPAETTPLRYHLGGMDGMNSQTYLDR